MDILFVILLSISCYFLLFSVISMAHILMHMRRWMCIVVFSFSQSNLYRTPSDLTSDGGTHGRDGPGDLSFGAGFRIRALYVVCVSVVDLRSSM